MLDFRLLGPVEVFDGSRAVGLPGRQPRALLAALLLSRGEPLSSERLIEALWGETAPTTARNSLQNDVSTLRRTLGHDVLVTTRNGYELAVDANQVDLGRFERLVAEAQGAISDEERANKLREGLALWRGPALANVAYEPFAQLEAPRLEQLRLAAQQDLIDAALALREHAEVLPALEELVATHPFDERLRAQLMLCMYRSGRQADALAAYRDARALLDAELGIEPSPPLRELEQAILRQDPALELPPQLPAWSVPARRTVTVLVADLRDSSRLDPEVFHGLLEQEVGVMREIVERHGGSVENFGGERLLAAFGLRASHEDDALRAVRAAVELRNAVCDELELRIGVDSGEAFVPGGDATTASITGSVISGAKRLVELAASQEILLAGGTLRRLAPDAVKRRRLDHDDCWRLEEVKEGASAIPRRLDSPLIGRKHELSALLERFASASTEQHAQAVRLVGEAGIGKTRLARELVDRVRNEATILVGRCVSYGQGATWSPLVEILHEVDSPDARRLADALGADTEVISVQETAFVARRLFETLAASRALVVVFDDVHWAEPALLELIDHVAARASGSILLLCVTRPELLDSRSEWADGAIMLGPLPDDDVTRLVNSLGAELGAEVRRRVVEVAEGNPLFAEQLVAHAREQGPASLDEVPPSIEGLIASRLDSLAPEERLVLQSAAVVGRRFSREAIVALTEADGVDDHFRALAERGLIRVGRGDALSFHHVLVRNVAYVQIPKRTRAEAHERVAAWIDENRAGPDELVGYHLEQAHRYHSELGGPNPRTVELGRRAGALLASAGRRAADQDDWHAAANLLVRAGALLAEDDVTRPAVLADLGEAYAALGAFERSTNVLEEAIAAARAADDRRTEWQALIQLSLFQRTTREDGWFEQARVDAQAAIALFSELGDDRGLALAWRFASWIDQWNGHYAGAVTALERALDHARRGGDVAEQKRIVGSMGPNLVFGSESARVATQRIRAELDRAEQNAHLALAASLRRDVGVLQAMGGDFDEARAALLQARAVLTDLGLVSDYGLCAASSGYVEALAGDFEAAEREYATARKIFEETGESCRRLTAEVEVAHTLFELGSDDEALRLVEVAARETPADEFYCHALWRTASAKLLARRGEIESAERLAREALALLEPTDDLATYAGALTDLADVLRAAGRAGEVTEALERAVQLYERKGNTVLAARARAQLEDVTASASG